MEGKHILLCGDVQVGKSTLIRRLLAANRRPVYGFITKKLEADPSGFHPIYIHRASTPEEERQWEESNCIGTCNRRIHNIRLSVFDTLGAQYINEARPDGLIVMDELGFMEAESKPFTEAVFQALCGDIPVLAAVKSRLDVGFLNEVRAMPRAEVYWVTEENRDALYGELLPIMQAWNRA